MSNDKGANQGAAAVRNDTVTKRFQTILVARSNTTRPSELEIQLRDYCEKMRVHTQLSGAHIILPCGTSLAIRAYYPHDLERIDNIDDWDGLPVFLEHFQTIVVFFVMPFAAQQAVMRDRNSFVRRAFDLLDNWHDSTNEQHKNPPRMVLVTDTREAVFYLMQMVDAMRPEKTKLRQEYFLRKQKQHLCLLPQVPDSNVLSDHIGKAVMEWAKLLDISPDDIRLIFMSVKTISSLAAMDDDTMANIPVDKSILLRLRNFFAGKSGDEDQSVDTRVPFDTNSHSMFEPNRGYPVELQTFSATTAMVSPPDPAPYAMGTRAVDYQTATYAPMNGSVEASMAIHPPSRAPQPSYNTQQYPYPYPSPPALHPQSQSRYSQPYVEQMKQLSPYPINVQPPYGHPPPHPLFVPQSPWMQQNEFSYGGASTPYRPPHHHHSAQLYPQAGHYQTPSQHSRNSSAPWGSSVSSRGRFAPSQHRAGSGASNLRNGWR